MTDKSQKNNNEEVEKKSKKAEKALLMYFLILLVPIIIYYIFYMLPKLSLIKVKKNMANYSVTIPAPEEAGDSLKGPVIYTADARDKVKWVYFDLSSGSVIEVKDEKNEPWDLKMQRTRILANTGAKQGLQGEYGIIELGDGALDDYKEVPEGIKFKGELEGWYNYEWVPSFLYPKEKVYAIHTTDNKFAKLKLLSYYCEAKEMGCITFQYVYQGNSSNKFN